MQMTLMRLAIGFAAVLTNVAGFAAAAAAAPARPSAARPASQPAASHPAEVTDDPRLPRVLLIGDSISIGYTEPTRKLLYRKANVHRIPVNGGPTTRGLESLEEWLGDDRWDVIHFNWGLHDLKRMEDGKHQVPIEEYERNLTQLVVRLKKTGAKLIWATTTPVPNAKVSPPRSNDDVIAYNAVALRIMQANGIAINDLYAFALPRLEELQRPANVHFTDQGSAALAEYVAGSILKAIRESTGPRPSVASQPATNPAR